MKLPLLISLLLLTASTFAIDKPLYALSKISPGAGVSEQEVSLIADRLRLEMLNTERVTMVEREEMNAILTEQGFQQSGACDDQSCIVEMGRLLGVQFIVTGSIGKVGSLTMVNFRVINVQTGAVENGVTRDIKGAIENVVNVLPELAKSLVSLSSNNTESSKSSKHNKSHTKIRIQLPISMTTGTATEVTTVGFGGGIAAGIERDRMHFKAFGDIHIPNDFIAGAGLSVGYDVIPDTGHVVEPFLFGGFWYGENKQDTTFSGKPIHTAFDFGGIGLMYEKANSSPFRFFVEPQIRLGSSDTYSIDPLATTGPDAPFKKQTKFQIRMVHTIGISVVF